MMMLRYVSYMLFSRTIQRLFHSIVKEHLHFTFYYDVFFLLVVFNHVTLANQLLICGAPFRQGSRVHFLSDSTKGYFLV